MDMVYLNELLHCLIDHTAEAALDGHVDHGRLDVMLGHPLKALCSADGSGSST